MTVTDRSKPQTEDDMIAEAKNHAESLEADLERLFQIERRNRDADEQWDHIVERCEENLRERCYGIDAKIVVTATLYGGGPAGGIDFHCTRERYGLELDYARVWHQDWFLPKGYADLDNDVAERLFQIWGIEYAGGFDGD